MPIKLYWMRGKGRDDPNQRNFGDYLSKEIVEMVSGEKVVWSAAKNADMLAIGTILNRLIKAQKALFGKRLHVWGTGSGGKEYEYSNKHYYHAVRGPLTASKLPTGIKVNKYGDPGLLSCELRKTKNKPIKKYRLGLIPHYVDHGSEEISKISENFPSLKMISVFDSIHNIMDSILECDLILSSSMHGLIVSDSLGVPNRWIKMSDSFEEFKFDDYYASHEIPTQVIRTPEVIDESLASEIIDSYHRPKLDFLKESLWNSFPKELQRRVL